MSDTPETDKQRAYSIVYSDATVPADFARKLERERDEAREKAERYRLEANAMMAQRDEARRKVAELQAGLDDIEEYGTEEINAAVDLRHQLGAALCKAAKLREALQSVMDWNPKPEYWERPETVARFEADMARAREVLRETRPTPNN